MGPVVSGGSAVTKNEEISKMKHASQKIQDQGYLHENLTLQPYHFKGWLLIGFEGWNPSPQPADIEE